MFKKEAINLLGGTVTSAAALIGVRPQAISGWPETLTPALRDRVQAALYRQHLARKPRAKVQQTAEASHA